MPNEKPQPTRTPAPPISEKGRWWGAVVFLVMFIIPDFLLADALYRGQCPSGAALVLLWFLIPPQVALVLWLRRPSSDFSITYCPPSRPLARPDRWRVELPGWRFVVVFAGVFMGLGLIGVTIIVATHTTSGVKWTFGGALGLTIVWLVVAGALGYRFHSRPRLEVDETRRELIWHPHTVLNDPLTLPFSVIADIRLVRIQTGDRDALHIEIDWRTAEGQTRTTRLPGSESREGVETVATRLRAATGLPPTPTDTAAPTDGKPQPSKFDRWGMRCCRALLILMLVIVNLEVAWMWYHQIRSSGFPVIQGVVLGHKHESAGRAGTRLLVEYRYEANGAGLISDRIWYESSFVASGVTYETIAAKFPVGASAAVSYNPANPSEAVLIPGLQGIDVLALWYLWFLNYCWLMLLLQSHPKLDVTAFYRLPPAGAVLTRWRFVLPSAPVWRSFGAAVCVGSAIAFVVAKESFGLFPPLDVAIGLTAAIIAMAFGWVLLTRRAVCLEVDAATRELRWRHGAWYTSTFHLPFEATTSVRTEGVEIGDGETICLAVIEYQSVRYRTRAIHLPECAERAQVEAVVSWLRAAVGLTREETGPTAPPTPA